MSPFHFRDSQPALSKCRRLYPRLLLFLSLLAAGTLTAVAVAASDDDSTRDDGPLVHTAEGPVIGFKQNGVYEFLGIPYAAPPVGPHRWMPPQPVAHWDRPLHATHFGNTCAQVTEFGVFAGPGSAREDCLFLNVFTTNLGNSGREKTSGSQGNPVLVWIHGGGNLDGESNDYDATKLATGGPNGTSTVIVTLNYRLGLFGFLAHPALDAEGHLHGNYGILDQQAVLRWVQRNIAAFGGDPARVTLGGQSAGAQDTGMNQISPLAAGLFQRTIYQSTPLTGIALMTVTVYPVALANGEAFAKAADCGVDASPATAACLRNLTTAQILQLEGTPSVPSALVTGAMLDGTIMPITPIEAWSTGKFNKTPILGGNVQDEANFGISIMEYFSTPQAPMTADEYIAGVTQTYSGPEFSGGPNYPPGTVAKILAQYPPDLDNLTPQQVANLVGSHPIGCSAVLIDQLWSKWVPVYAYEFNDEQAPYYFPPLPEFAPLAAHTIDIQFFFKDWHGSVFGVNHPANLSPAEEVLSDELIAAWTHFAATGNPNGHGNSPWPQFTATANMPAILSERPGLGTFTREEWSKNHHCTFWTGNTVNGGILRFPPF
jgi:para-nitrobenzyl esterase